MTDRLTPQQRGARNRALGDAAEWQVRRHLALAGYRCIERIETGWRVHRDHRTGRIVGATPLAKVSGDFRAVAPDGRAVLVEVKQRERLIWSDLEDHQVKALNEHAKAGAIALLAWVRPEGGGLTVHPWPIPGFGPRKALAEVAHAP